MQKDKYAVISIDVEDWYHTYFPDMDVDKSISALDGLDVILNLLKDEKIKGSFFVVGEIANSIARKLQEMDRLGHDVACHNYIHIDSERMTAETFEEQLVQSKTTLEGILGHSISGYRAPSFSINDWYLGMVKKHNFLYDSSYIKPQWSKKYGSLCLDGFEEIHPCIYREGNFTEFEVSTQKVGPLNILLGGGYVRMLPWFIIKPLIKRYLKTEKTYVMYLHPIDFSNQKLPKMKMGLDRYLRTHIGRKSEIKKLKKIIKMIKDCGYKFVTFEQLRYLLNTKSLL